MSIPKVSIVSERKIEPQVPSPSSQDDLLVKAFRANKELNSVNDALLNKLGQMKQNNSALFNQCKTIESENYKLRQMVGIIEQQKKKAETQLDQAEEMRKENKKLKEALSSFEKLYAENKDLAEQLKNKDSQTCALNDAMLNKIRQIKQEGSKLSDKYKTIDSENDKLRQMIRIIEERRQNTEAQLNQTDDIHAENKKLKEALNSFEKMSAENTRLVELLKNKKKEGAVKQAINPKKTPSEESTQKDGLISLLKQRYDEQKKKAEFLEEALKGERLSNQTILQKQGFYAETIQKKDTDTSRTIHLLEKSKEELELFRKSNSKMSSELESVKKEKETLDQQFSAVKKELESLEARNRHILAAHTKEITDTQNSNVREFLKKETSYKLEIERFKRAILEQNILIAQSEEREQKMIEELNDKLRRTFVKQLAIFRESMGGEYESTLKKHKAVSLVDADLLKQIGLSEEEYFSELHKILPAIKIAMQRQEKPAKIKESLIHSGYNKQLVEKVIDIYNNE